MDKTCVIDFRSSDESLSRTTGIPSSGIGTLRKLNLPKELEVTIINNGNNLSKDELTKFLSNRDKNKIYSFKFQDVQVVSTINQDDADIIKEIQSEIKKLNSSKINIELRDLFTEIDNFKKSYALQDDVVANILRDEKSILIFVKKILDILPLKNKIINNIEKNKKSDIKKSLNRELQYYIGNFENKFEKIYENITSEKYSPELVLLIKNVKKIKDSPFNANSIEELKNELDSFFKATV